MRTQHKPVFRPGISGKAWVGIIGVSAIGWLVVFYTLMRLTGGL